MKKLEAMKKDKEIKAMYKVYKTAFKGKDSFNLYVKNLSEFFRITMDIYCFGVRGVPKGCGKGPNVDGEWGRADAIYYWSQKCKIKRRDINKYFYSVDEVSPYS
jgi:hypothetical protein